MTFKEFVDWCNERACDGCWGMGAAIECINVITEVRKQPFWRRDKKWQEINKEYNFELLVNSIDQRIKEVLGK